MRYFVKSLAALSFPLFVIAGPAVAESGDHECKISEFGIEPIVLQLPRGEILRPVKLTNAYIEIWNREGRLIVRLNELNRRPVSTSVYEGSWIYIMDYLYKFTLDCKAI